MSCGCLENHSPISVILHVLSALFSTNAQRHLHQKWLSYGVSLPLCMQVAKAVSHSLNNCVNCLPGQKDVDVALKSIGESSKKLLVDSVRSLPGEGYLVSSPHKDDFLFPAGSEHLAFPWSPAFLPFSISFLVTKVPKGGLVRCEFVQV